ncbi:MAG TPA: diacylglycerol kinase family protein [Mycobacteriales bacterium]|nr:diacylglycerol kinase family protein [Mycobacteriales bacterium]
MRALLVVNPKATATTARGRDILSRALGSDLKLDVAETERRGHARVLARQAVRDEFDLVVALGGDGTVNECVNGLLDDGPGSTALAVVPGGGANVFARTLGLPLDPVEATSAVLEALRAGRSRRIGVGRADDRHFTFTAGLGLDAAAVHSVDRARRRGRRSTPQRYLRAAVNRYLLATDRRHPAITFEPTGGEPVPGLFVAIVSNCSPWTYFGDRPVYTSPRASYDDGLDLFAMRRLGVPSVTRAGLGMLSARQIGPRGRAAVHRHDLAGFRLIAERPLDFQVDGEYLGERQAVSFTACPGALRVIA